MVHQLAGVFFFAVVVRVHRSGGGPFMLVELRLVEQPYQAVAEVLEGASVERCLVRHGLVTVRARKRRREDYRRWERSQSITCAGGWDGGY
jgi:hypothetical protein